MSNALVIQATDGAHIGFILTHFESDISQVGSYEGECVFVALPKDPAYLNHPLLDRMYEHKFAGEHKCVLVIASGRKEYSIRLDSVKPLRILFAAGEGKLIDVGTSNVIGKAVET